MSTLKAAKFTRDELSRMAGARAFERGETYAASRRVTSLAEDLGRITAQVRGMRTYRVTL